MSGEAPIPEHVHRGIETVAAIHARAEQNITRHQRFIERATSAVGRPRSLYFILGVTMLWTIANVAAPRLGMQAIDPPPFSFLQGVMTFAALVVATMVLTTQNRHARISERRSHLDLQVNLLAEQKIAKLIQLVEELRVDLPNVKNREDPVAKAMQEQVDARAVQEVLDETLGAQRGEEIIDRDPTDPNQPSG